MYRYTLTTSDGFEVALIEYGAIIQSIRQADKQNQFDEITLGYDDLQGRFISNGILIKLSIYQDMWMINIVWVVLSVE